METEGVECSVVSENHCGEQNQENENEGREHVVQDRENLNHDREKLHIDREKIDQNEEKLYQDLENVNEDREQVNQDVIYKLSCFLESKQQNDSADSNKDQQQKDVSKNHKFVSRLLCSQTWHEGQRCNQHDGCVEGKPSDQGKSGTEYKFQVTVCVDVVEERGNDTKGKSPYKQKMTDSQISHNVEDTDVDKKQYDDAKGGFPCKQKITDSQRSDNVEYIDVGKKRYHGVKGRPSQQAADSQKPHQEQMMEEQKYVSVEEKSNDKRRTEAQPSKEHKEGIKGHSSILWKQLTRNTSPTEDPNTVDDKHRVMDHSVLRRQMTKKGIPDEVYERKGKTASSPFEIIHCAANNTLDLVEKKNMRDIQLGNSMQTSLDLSTDKSDGARLRMVNDVPLKEHHQTEPLEYFDESDKTEARGALRSETGDTLIFSNRTHPSSWNGEEIMHDFQDSFDQITNMTFKTRSPHSRDRPLLKCNSFSALDLSMSNYDKNACMTNSQFSAESEFFTSQTNDYSFTSRSYSFPGTTRMIRNVSLNRFAPGSVQNANQNSPMDYSSTETSVKKCLLNMETVGPPLSGDNLHGNRVMNKMTSRPVNGLTRHHRYESDDQRLRLVMPGVDASSTSAADERNKFHNTQDKQERSELSTVKDERHRGDAVRRVFHEQQTSAVIPQAGASRASRVVHASPCSMSEGSSKPVDLVTLQRRIPSQGYNAAKEHDFPQASTELGTSHSLIPDQPRSPPLSAPLESKVFPSMNIPARQFPIKSEKHLDSHANDPDEDGKSFSESGNSNCMRNTSQKLRISPPLLHCSNSNRPKQLCSMSPPLLVNAQDQVNVMNSGMVASLT